MPTVAYSLVAAAIVCGLIVLRDLSRARFGRLSLMRQLLFVLLAATHVFLMGVVSYVFMMSGL